MLPILITTENLPALADALDNVQGRKNTRGLCAEQLLQAAQELEQQLAENEIAPESRPGAAGLLSAEGPGDTNSRAEATQAVLSRDPDGWQVDDIYRGRIHSHGAQCLLNLSHAQAEFVYQQRLQKKRLALPGMTRKERWRALRAYPALIPDVENPLASEFEMVADLAPQALEPKHWAAFSRKAPEKAVRCGFVRQDLCVWHSVLYGLAGQTPPKDLRTTPDAQLLAAAIRKYPPAIRLVTRPSAALGELAVSLEGALIAALSPQTARQQIIALHQDPSARTKIKDSTVLADADKLAVALQLDWQNPAHADFLRALLPPLPDREPGQTP